MKTENNEHQEHFNDIISSSPKVNTDIFKLMPTATPVCHSIDKNTKVLLPKYSFYHACVSSNRELIWASE